MHAATRDTVRAAWFSKPILLGLILCTAAMGQTQPAGPTLEDLNCQTQALYHRIELGVVRVQLPTTRPGTELDRMLSPDPLTRWYSKLNPEILVRLEQIRAAGTTYNAEALPATRPGGAVLLYNPVTAEGSIQGIPFRILSPNVLGLVVDDQGHVLLPVYEAKENVGSSTFPALLSDGTLTQARFIGSDYQSRSTLVQVGRPGLVPLPLGSGPPAEGSLVMALALDPSLTRLAVWTRWSGNLGLVIQTDGTVAGFSDRGRFVCASAYMPVVRQLIAHGFVERARLGVRIQDVMSDDAERDAYPALGDTPAVRVGTVIPNSAAEKGGVQVGDLILSMAGRSVGDKTSFAGAIAERRGPTELKIFRQGNLMSITVDLQPTH